MGTIYSWGRDKPLNCRSEVLPEDGNFSFLEEEQGKRLNC